MGVLRQANQRTPDEVPNPETQTVSADSSGVAVMSIQNRLPLGLKIAVLRN